MDGWEPYLQGCPEHHRWRTWSSPKGAYVVLFLTVTSIQILIPMGTSLFPMDAAAPNAW